MDDADALWLTFLKDAILAVYQSRASLWQSLQGGAMAAIPIAALAAFAGPLSARHLMAVLAVCAAVALLCAGALLLNQRLMERDLRKILDQIGRVKRGT